VYRGRLKSGEVVAVKRAKAERRQDMRKFKKEVMLLSRARHKHLVQLLGYCREEQEQLLVYEFIGGGTLSHNLNAPWRARQNKPPLNWTERLLVAAGTARALAYLHDDVSMPFIHRDVKPGNILLDRHVVAKLADFGTSRAVDTSSYSATIQGTAVQDLLDKKGLAGIVDQSMGIYAEKEVTSVLTLAFKCTDIKNPAARPSMNRVSALATQTIARLRSLGFRTFASALEKTDVLSALPSTVARPGGFSLLVPSDRAFLNLPQAVQKLLRGPDAKAVLKNLILYHIFQPRINFNYFLKLRGRRVKTLLRDQTLTVGFGRSGFPAAPTVAGGESLWFAPSDGGKRVADSSSARPAGGGSAGTVVIVKDVAYNGLAICQAVSVVLVPPLDLLSPPNASPSATTTTTTATKSKNAPPVSKTKSPANGGSGGKIRPPPLKKNVVESASAFGSRIAAAAGAGKRGNAAPVAVPSPVIRPSSITLTPQQQVLYWLSRHGLGRTAANLAQSGVLDLATADNPVTVLAPTQLAYRFLPWTVRQLFFTARGEQVLPRLMKYHVITERLTVKQLRSAGNNKYPTLLDEHPVDTKVGSTFVRFSPEPPDYAAATIIPGSSFSNGIATVHVSSSVLIPPYDLLSIPDPPTPAPVPPPLGPAPGPGPAPAAAGTQALDMVGDLEAEGGAFWAEAKLRASAPTLPPARPLPTPISPLPPPPPPPTGGFVPKRQLISFDDSRGEPYSAAPPPMAEPYSTAPPHMAVDLAQEGEGEVEGEGEGEGEADEVDEVREAALETAAGSEGREVYGEPGSESGASSDAASGASSGASSGARRVLPELSLSARQQTIDELAKRGLTVLAKNLAATRILDSLSGPATLLAPTNLAFWTLPLPIKALLMGPKADLVLRNLVAYHILPRGRVSSKQFEAGIEAAGIEGYEIFDTLLEGRSVKAEHVGKALAFSPLPMVPLLSRVARVVASDINTVADAAANEVASSRDDAASGDAGSGDAASGDGITIHVINRVLIPPVKVLLAPFDSPSSSSSSSSAASASSSPAGVATAAAVNPFSAAYAASAQSMVLPMVVTSPSDPPPPPPSPPPPAADDTIMSRLRLFGCTKTADMIVRSGFIALLTTATSPNVTFFAPTDDAHTRIPAPVKQLITDNGAAAETLLLSYQGVFGIQTYAELTNKSTGSLPTLLTDMSVTLTKTRCPYFKRFYREPGSE
ncbi:unnamed protein product, partial [Closterium sp. Naga37s-1]